MAKRWRVVWMVMILAGAGAALGTALGQAVPGMATAGANGELRMRGQTEPAARVEVPAAMHGILSEVGVKEGQAVKRGQALAKLDDLLQIQRVEFERLGAEGTVDIRAAQAQVDYARNDFERTRAVQGVSPYEVQQKDLAFKQSELALEKARERQKENQIKLKQEQLTLERMTLRSPIDGSVLRVNKQAGELTDEGPVVVVVQTSRLNAVFYPPRQLFGKVSVGDRCVLDMEGLAREGVVVAVDPMIDPASQIFRVKLEVDNADGKIAAGVSATWVWGGRR